MTRASITRRKIFCFMTFIRYLKLSNADTAPGVPPPPYRSKIVYLFFLSSLIKEKRLLHVKIWRPQRASPLGPPPGLCPSPTGGFKAAPSLLLPPPPPFRNFWIRHWLCSQGHKEKHLWTVGVGHIYIAAI